MRYTALWVTFGLLLFSLGACKNKRLPAAEPARAPQQNLTEDPAFADSMSGKVNAFALDWKTLNAKVKVEVAGNQLTASLRMQRDSIIWMSLSAALGIEVARIMITPDSLFYLNRLNGEKRREANGQAALLAGFPLQLELVQSMLLGTIPSGPWNQKARVNTDTATALLLSAPKYQCVAEIDTQNYTLTKMVLTALAGAREMKINFGGYASASGRPFSFDRQYRIYHNTGGVEADVHFTRAVFNEPLAGFPFDSGSR